MQHGFEILIDVAVLIVTHAGEEVLDEVDLFIFRPELEIIETSGFFVAIMCRRAVRPRRGGDAPDGFWFLLVVVEEKGDEEGQKGTSGFRQTM